jgi:hypothetical protein
LHRLRDYQRVSLFSGIFLGLCLYSYHVRELLACWLFFCLLFALVALLMLAGLLASQAAKYVMDWTNAGRPPGLLAGIEPVKLQQLTETLENSAILSAETGLQTPVWSRSCEVPAPCANDSARNQLRKGIEISRGIPLHVIDNQREQIWDFLFSSDHETILVHSETEGWPKLRDAQRKRIQAKSQSSG